MRRAWLLALAVAPAVAAGQVTPSQGQVTFDDNFINASECVSGDVSLSWDVTFIVTGNATIPPDGEYHVYAANQQHTGNTCHTSDNTSTGLKAGQVGNMVVATGRAMGPLPFAGREFVAKAGKDCSATSQETIYVCVQGTAKDGADPKFGFATGTLTLDVRKPPPPVVEDRPGEVENALLVTWSPGNATSAAGADSQEYILEARAVGTTTGATDPQGIHTSGRTSDNTAYRFSGLVNSVVYEVRAFAFSAADNESDPSNVVTGMPQPTFDFAEYYHLLGGREQGGCGVGSAGAASLLMAAGVLAMLRRRK